jgi:hypothetical protein
MKDLILSGTPQELRSPQAHKVSKLGWEKEEAIRRKIETSWYGFLFVSFY